jgi:hypothetical protein
MRGWSEWKVVVVGYRLSLFVAVEHVNLLVVAVWQMAYNPNNTLDPKKGKSSTRESLFVGDRAKRETVERRRAEDRTTVLTLIVLVWDGATMECVWARGG